MPSADSSDNSFMLPVSAQLEAQRQTRRTGKDVAICSIPQTLAEILLLRQSLAITEHAICDTARSSVCAL